MLVQTPRKPACRSPPDGCAEPRADVAWSARCCAEPRADADLQTEGYGSASMVLQDHECIWVQARARQKPQVLVIHSGHASELEASAT